MSREIQFVYDQNLIETIVTIVAGYTFLWTLVPYRTAYYGAIWYLMWRCSDTRADIKRILVITAIQAIFFRAFSSVISLGASLIILVASNESETSAKVLRLYPLFVLCTYANSVLAN